jgi:hypothetical protein
MAALTTGTTMTTFNVPVTVTLPAQVLTQFQVSIPAQTFETVVEVNLADLAAALAKYMMTAAPE